MTPRLQSLDKCEPMEIFLSAVRAFSDADYALIRSRGNDDSTKWQLVSAVEAPHVLPLDLARFYPWRRKDKAALLSEDDSPFLINSIDGDFFESMHEMPAEVEAFYHEVRQVMAIPLGDPEDAEPVVVLLRSRDRQPFTNEEAVDTWVFAQVLAQKLTVERLHASEPLRNLPILLQSESRDELLRLLSHVLSSALGFSFNWVIVANQGVGNAGGNDRNHISIEYAVGTATREELLEVSAQMGTCSSLRLELAAASCEADINQSLLDSLLARSPFISSNLRPSGSPANGQGSLTRFTAGNCNVGESLEGCLGALIYYHEPAGTNKTPQDPGKTIDVSVVSLELLGTATHIFFLSPFSGNAEPSRVYSVFAYLSALSSFLQSRNEGRDAVRLSRIESALKFFGIAFERVADFAEMKRDLLDNVLETSGNEVAANNH